MRRWPAFLTKGSDAWAGVVVWSAGVVIGLASERAAFGWDDFSGWIPDLVVGLVFIGCGVQAMARDRGTAVLLAAAGFTWFLANFWIDALFLHRGLLVHLLVTYPGWRARSRLDVVVVTVGYVAAIFVPVWRNEPTAIVLACVLVVVVVRRFVVSPGRLRRARRTAFMEDEPEWARFIDPAYLNGEYAHAFRDLGRPAESARFARVSADEAAHQHRARRGSLAHATLARSALVDHELEAAAAAATTTVELAVAVRSNRSNQAVLDLRERLGEHQASPRVAEFFELADALMPSRP